MKYLPVLRIDATKSTPAVTGEPDQYQLKLAGQAYPENAFKFFEPIFQWVDELLQRVDEQAKIKIEIDLAYINTSSSKCIMMLLEKFEDAFDQGKSLQLDWYYNADNESELECAEEFKEDFCFPFAIIAKSKDEL